MVDSNGRLTAADPVPGVGDDIESTILTAFLLLTVLALAALSGCGRSSADRGMESGSALSGRSTPFAFCYRYPSYSRSPVVGLLVAVWENGRMVRAATDSPEHVGKSYVEARLSRSQVEELRTLLQRFFLKKSDRELERESLVLDAASEGLWFITAARVANTQQSLPLTESSVISQVKAFCFGIEASCSVEIDEHWREPPPPGTWLEGAE
jgi:hypothetical protein